MSNRALLVVIVIFLGLLFVRLVPVPENGGLVAPVPCGY